MPHLSRPLLATVSALLLLLLLAGCSTYDSAYHYGSRPTSAPLPGDVGHAARVEAQVLGVRENADGPRAGIDVRLRVERSGAVPVSVSTGDLRLVTAGSEELMATDVRALGPVIPAAGGAASFEVTFALPGRRAGAFDLHGLSLLVPLDVDGHRETTFVAFEKSPLLYLWTDPWGWPGTDFSGNPTGWRQ